VHFYPKKDFSKVIFKNLKLNPNRGSNISCDISFNILLYQEIKFFGVTGIFSQNALSPKIIIGVFGTFLHFFGFLGVWGGILCRVLFNIRIHREFLIWG